MRVLITGAGGFIGANLTRRMISLGHNVHILLHPQSNPWRLNEILKQVNIHSVDLKDQNKVSEAISISKPDWIFHLAVHGAYSWQNQDGDILCTNVLGTMNLLQSSIKQGFDAFINTGSSSEYGFKDHAPKENEWLEPNSTYSASKIAATLFCEHQAKATNTRIATMRLYSVYGPWEEPKRLVPSLLVHGIQGLYPPLTNPDTARDYIYIDDVVDAYINAAEKIKPGIGEIFNVGSGIQTSIAELVTITNQIFPNRGLPQWGSMQNRIWDTNTWVSNPDKLISNLGWLPKTNLQKGLSLFTMWLKSSKTIQNYYESQLLPRKIAS